MNNIETITKPYVVMREKKPKQTLDDEPLEVFGWMRKKSNCKGIEKPPMWEFI